MNYLVILHCSPVFTTPYVPSSAPSDSNRVSSSWPFSDATWKGLFPSLFWICRSAPCSSKTFAAWSCPKYAAWCNGVWRSAFCAFTPAPRSSNSRATSARCKASLTAALGIVHFGTVHTSLLLLVSIPFIGVPSFRINPSISAQNSI